ncbi:short chain dehydrogenase family protein [Candidatus Endolissoclinum faulkneri L2]|uniref:Short chain dehydrogenase family protein n=1 Tax=Candidatus Endolissoclinum faulkneri L2 TaxID=1193729 RepID=K7ZD05_9PROT|nr:SDR family oxidoreductase [Candidatus Endolissoclinum faulkneri]AFX99056.1 short chain dehydrogenase family protein [Candidatus Endolissoclinum faulkneri L2]
MQTIFITGANRGIGLELAKQYASDHWHVIATCRNPLTADRLKAVKGDVVIYQLDVSDINAIDLLVDKLKSQPIDVLFNNAGININKGISIGDIDYDAWARTMETNVFAPIRLAWKFKKNVLSSARKVMAFTSSLMGSIQLNRGGNVVYRSSKTALNMAANCLARELTCQGLIVAILHPGHVKTDMGGKDAPVTVIDSVRGMRNIIANLTPEDNFCFMNYDAKRYPW